LIVKFIPDDETVTGVEQVIPPVSVQVILPPELPDQYMLFLFHINTMLPLSSLAEPGLQLRL
jgi:hypothetical protein